jgi:hypothetical protein
MAAGLPGNFTERIPGQPWNFFIIIKGKNSLKVDRIKDIMDNKVN